MATLTVVSGTGPKEPACFLVDDGHARVMLDLGYGPRPGARPAVAGIGRVDALLLSHSHRDHAGSLTLRTAVGNPEVHATDIARRRLPPQSTQHSLPLQGRTTASGITVTTGRSGHAPGGVWLHLAAGDGLLYMGDNGVESIVYAHDTPPPAGVVIVDASYGVDDTALADRVPAFDAVFDAGPVLLPVPPAGRGPEMALHANRRGMYTRVDDAMRASLQNLATVDSACVRADALAEIERLAGCCGSIEDAADVMLAAVADATGGAAAGLVERWHDADTPAIVFSGYLTPGTPAEHLTQSGRARYLCWNVHPRLSDNVRLARAVGAHTVVPAFGDAHRHQGDWVAAYAPARVQIGGTVSL